MEFEISTVVTIVFGENRIRFSYQGGSLRSDVTVFAAHRELRGAGELMKIFRVRARTPQSRDARSS